MLATKAYLPQGPGPNNQGLSQIHLARALEASLRLLGTDYVDLYQCHQWDGSATWPLPPTSPRWPPNSAPPRPDVALACVARQPSVTAVIIGPRTVGQLRGNLAAFSLSLPPTVLTRLNEASQPASSEPVTGMGAHR